MADAVLNLIHIDLGTLVLKHACPSNSLPNHIPSDCQDSPQDETRTGAAPPSCCISGAVDTTYIFLDEKQIGRGRIGRVYRGYIQRPEGSLSSVYPGTYDTRVVVKLVVPRGRIKGKKLYPKGHDGLEILADLATEASIYSQMHAIQGEVVPRCYGYYLNDVAGCLVLEDCGNDLKFPYRRLELGERRAIFALQKKLHQVGVSHGDVARRNFVKGPQGIRLLDFDKAVRHGCRGFEEPKFEADHAKFKEAEDVCSELRKLFVAFGLLPMEYYSPRERETYKSWDGEPWWP